MRVGCTQAAFGVRWDVAERVRRGGLHRERVDGGFGGWMRGVVRVDGYGPWNGDGGFCDWTMSSLAASGMVQRSCVVLDFRGASDNLSVS